MDPTGEAQPMSERAQRVFVVSDLHLGGEPGFQICGAEGQALLTRFIREVTATHRAKATDGTDRDAHLVLAGDVVDFLAEAPSTGGAAMEAELLSDTEACARLENIFKNTAAVWAALRDHVAAGAPLTLMVGNHDIEASLPKTRRRLLRELGVGRVELLYDNEALSIGALLIEHGNRYDKWNWVDHDSLRQVRSSVSRGEKPLPFALMPGSKLVIRQMNPLKAKFSFIDLLKPETAAMLPFLVLLAPEALADVHTLWDAAQLGSAVARRDFDESRPASRGLGPRVTAPEPEYDADMLALIDHVAAAPGPDAPTGASRGLVETGAVWVNSFFAKGSREKGLRLLYRALQPLAGGKDSAFVVECEEEPYLSAAERSFKRGFQVVVYGHTHLPKRQMYTGDNGSEHRYFNSGTWADLMRVPDAIIEGTEDEALAALDAFAEDLATNNLAKWRRPAPTFVRVDLDADDTITHSDVYRYLGETVLDLEPLPPGRFVC
jgi:UDP-2,3-diacylglucosamine pyrophosphatase LpxH